MMRYKVPISSLSIVQIRPTYGAVTHSQILTIQEIVSSNIQQHSILTPLGYTPFKLHTAQHQETYKISITAMPSNTKIILNTPHPQSILNWDTQEPINSILELNTINTSTDSKPALYTYLNTDTDCRGFHIRPSVAYTDTIDIYPDPQPVYWLCLSNPKVYIDRVTHIARTENEWNQ